MIRAALVGNPNTGKTSLFNVLTGSYEYVGNWAGVTVEKKVGQLKNKLGTLIDLPGIYSTSPLTRDEGVASQFLLTEPCDLLVNIVDASQLERNLYLTLQLLELEIPMVIGLNMTDVAAGRGQLIDERKLAELMQVPVFPIVARTGKGCSELSSKLASTAERTRRPIVLDYGPAIEEALKKMEPLLPAKPGIPKRWLGLQLLEQNPVVQELLKAESEYEPLQQLAQETENAVLLQYHVKSITTYIRHVRSGFIGALIKKSVLKTKRSGITFTDRVDRLVTNKVLGLPIFLAFMYLTFKLTFDWLGTPLSDLLDGFLTGPLTDWLTTALDAINASDLLHALVIDGIVAGVGGVLVFVPQIFILFLVISFIEDSGYMARVTMVMDKVMEAVGLNGKAFIPMIIGFGCNVPGVMAARTIEQPRERLLTTLLLPLMSCSARLPVYSVFVAAFFVGQQALVVLSLYVLGIVVALALAKLFTKTLLRHEESMFIVELPPYRVPQFQALFRNTWEKGKGFVKKAGTMIFGGSVAIWLLGYMGPGGFGVEMNDSFLSYIGRGIAPLLAPIGFGTWEAGSSLLVGFLAKEVVVSAMNIIYAAPDDAAFNGILSQVFTPLQAYSFMAFVLLYVPCLATVGTIKKETMSSKWTWFSIGYSLVIAYIICLIIYQGGKLLGF
ncbi:ferrous iron transport protein B [Gorillibacterium sp. sgz5001074]|uniref:ferrous iron transport protein B n=1 Tax=Gorillibacterium sp. sgz5001074 TaxID=3446695 RepID=UPI003F6625E1